MTKRALGAAVTSAMLSGVTAQDYPTIQPSIVGVSQTPTLSNNKNYKGSMAEAIDRTHDPFHNRGLRWDFPYATLAGYAAGALSIAALEEQRRRKNMGKVTGGKRTIKKYRNNNKKKRNQQKKSIKKKNMKKKSMTKRNKCTRR